MLTIYRNSVPSFRSNWSFPLISWDTIPVPLDVHETDSEITVRADMPGIGKNDFTITYEPPKARVVHGDSSAGWLQITGKRDNVEYRSGVNLRGVDAAKASAELSNGVLTIRIPRTKDSRAIKISVI